MPPPKTRALATEVAAFHANDDLNKSNGAHHHSLGTAPYEASPGTHTHDGRDSKSLLEGTIFTGSLSGDTDGVLSQVVAALTKLGAQNTTVA